MPAVEANFLVDLLDTSFKNAIAETLIDMDPPDGWGDGSSGGGTLGQRESVNISPGVTTTSNTFVQLTGSALPAISVSVGQKVNLRFSGSVGHSSAGTIVDFTIMKNGVAVIPSGSTAIHSVRVIDNNYVNTVSFEFDDVISTSGSVVYSIAWKTFGSTAYLGRRAQDSIMLNPAFFSAQVI